MIILILETLGEMLKSTKRQIIRINNKMHEIVYNNINIDYTILGKKNTNTLYHITRCIILCTKRYTKIQENRRIKERKLISLISM